VAAVQAVAERWKGQDSYINMTIILHLTVSQWLYISYIYEPPTVAMQEGQVAGVAGSVDQIAGCGTARAMIRWKIGAVSCQQISGENSGSGGGGSSGGGRQEGGKGGDGVDDSEVGRKAQHAPTEAISDESLDVSMDDK